MSKVKIIEVVGFKVEVHNFGYATYMYPSFNGNAEFEVNHKGFRKLHHYLRTVKWLNNLGK